jgi:hypothetical protein
MAGREAPPTQAYHKGGGKITAYSRPPAEGGAAAMKNALLLPPNSIQACTMASYIINIRPLFCGEPPLF